MSLFVDHNSMERQQRLMEVLKGITQLFKRLHVCWDRSQDHTGGMEYASIEGFIPLKEEMAQPRRDIRMELEKKRGKYLL
jgi:hypothetical protein